MACPYDRGEIDCIFSQPAKRAKDRSPWRKPWGTLWKRKKLLLKRHAAVMLFLVAEISRHGRRQRAADAERSAAGLPVEAVIIFRPLRGLQCGYGTVFCHLVLGSQAEGLAEFLFIDDGAHGEIGNGRGWPFLAVAYGKQGGHQEVVGNMKVGLDLGLVEFGYPIGR